MYLQGSQEFNNAIEKDMGRTFRAKIILSDGTELTNIKSLNVYNGSNLNDDIAIGTTVMGYIEAELFTDVMIMGTIRLEVGVQLSNGNYEYMPMGTYTVSELKTKSGIKTIKANDNMVKFEKVFNSSLAYPTKATILLTELCGMVGVNFNGELPYDIDIPNKLEGYTCREVLGYIAGLYGKFAVINKQGLLEIRWYSDTTITKPLKLVYSFENQDKYTIGKVTIAKDSETSFTKGDGALGVSASNPYATQEVVDKVYTALNGFFYYPATVKLLGDIRLDVWDVLAIEYFDGIVYKIPLMKLHQRITGGCTTEVYAYGKSDVEKDFSYAGPITKNLQRTHTELLITNELLAGKVDAEYVRTHAVDTDTFNAMSGRVLVLETDTLKSRDAELKYATIEELRGINSKFETFETTTLKAKDAELKYATITNFDAVSGRVNTLETNSLTANSSVIANLQGGIADINTLIFGSATGTTIQTEFSNSVIAQLGNATIKNAMIDTVSANKINAGTINTNNVAIQSEDGSMRIQGTLQQFLDENGDVRLQLGKDASGNYTFIVTDGNGAMVMSADGITANAVPDGLIVNDMVAENANIKGSKLDIDSVISTINDNGTESIKSTKVFFDEQNQSLDVLFAKQTLQLEELTNQAYGKVETFQVKEIPTLYNYPAMDWTDMYVRDEYYPSETLGFRYTEDEYRKHLGTICYVEGTTDAYRFIYTDGGYSWLVIENSETAVLETHIADLTLRVDGLNSNYTTLTQKVNANTTELSTVNSKITQTSNEILLQVSGTYATKTALSEQNKTLQSSINATENAILSTVSNTYATKSALNNANNSISTLTTRITKAEEKITDDAIIQTVSQTVNNARDEAISSANDSTDEKLANYSTTTQMNSVISQKANDITLSVSNTYATKSALNETNSNITSLTTRVSNAEQKITDEAIISTVSSTITEAKNSAISSANNTTDEKLKSYSTTAQMQSAITQKANDITLSISNTYATKSELNEANGNISDLDDRMSAAELKITDSAIISTVSSSIATAKTEAINSANSSTDEKLKSYSTTSQMNSVINQTASDVKVSVSNTYATKTALNTTNSNLSSLETRVSNAELKITDSAIISTVSSTFVGKSSIISEINQSAESVSISASKINFNGVVTANNSFKINTDGSFEANSGTIGGWVTDATSLRKGKTAWNDSTNAGIWLGSGTGIYIGGGGATNWQNENCFWVGLDGVAHANGAVISGTINADAGNIAGWQIMGKVAGRKTGTLFNGIGFTNQKGANPDTALSTGMGNHGDGDWAFWAGDGRFSVKEDGTLYAEKGKIGKVDITTDGIRINQGSLEIVNSESGASYTYGNVKFQSNGIVIYNKGGSVMTTISWARFCTVLEHAQIFG